MYQKSMDNGTGIIKLFQPIFGKLGDKMHAHCDKKYSSSLLNVCQFTLNTHGYIIAFDKLVSTVNLRYSSRLQPTKVK